MKKLIVTGHLGFIGSAFCEMFQDKYEISGIDFAGWGSMEENLAPGIKDFRADISDHDSIRSIIDQVAPDAIVNFAAESHVDRSNEDDTAFWKSNVIGARTLAKEACRLRIRMVHVSTDEIYGDASSSSAAWTENSPVSPKNPYAVTKASAEMLLKVYEESRKTSLDLVITRGANTVGARQFPEKAVPKAIWCFTHGKSFPLYRTPARRMWLHVRDHVEGIEAALRNGRKGSAYNIAPGPDSEEMTENVIEKVRELVGSGRIEKVEDRDNYDLRYWMSAEKAEKELGWRASRGIDTTLKDTVDWYLSNSQWLDKAYSKAVNA